MKFQKKKIVVAMSGGVDSSVSAALLAREGHEVIGVTMRLLPPCQESAGCCGAPEDVLVAKRCAEKAGIPHYVLDYSVDFDQHVIRPFIDSYLKGETPNPCLACNQFIKFEKLKAFAHSLGATHLATGHYARIIETTGGDKPFFQLFEAVDSTKDQSYVLYTLGQSELSSMMFPLGENPKTKVRELAKEFGLPNADKKDSQEICFIPDNDYGRFLMSRFTESGVPLPRTLQPGPIKNERGDVVGEHKGIAYYTVGQRKGLVLKTQHPHYVTRLEPDTNTLVVGRNDEGQAAGLLAEALHWIAGAAPQPGENLLVKIRYKHEPVEASLRIENEKAVVHFKTPEKAVTPGQAAVFYRWDEFVKARAVLGGGTIIKAIRGTPHAL